MKNVLAYAQTFGRRHGTMHPCEQPKRKQSPNGGKHEAKPLPGVEEWHLRTNPVAQVQLASPESKLNGIEHTGGGRRTTATHQELVDAEAGVDGDDAAPVVLHPPLHRGPRRVLRQQLRQTLARGAQRQRVREEEAVTSRAQSSENGSRKPETNRRRVP